MNIMQDEDVFFWIDLDRQMVNQFVYFRTKIVALTKDLDIAVVSHGQYRIYCNGIRVGEGPPPSSPEAPYEEHWSFEVQPGLMSCIAVEVYHLGEKTKMTTSQNQGAPGIRIRFAPGTVKVPPIWLALRPSSRHRDSLALDPMACRISMWGGYKEIFLAGEEPVAWKDSNFDDVAWASVVDVTTAMEIVKVLDWGGHTLERGICHPQGVVQYEPCLGQIDGKWIHASTPGSFPSLVYDFGTEVVGFPVVELIGKTGGALSLWYGECLDMYRIDTLIMNDGYQLWELFHRRAFRYIKLVFSGFDEPVQLLSVRIQTVRANLDTIGSFICSSERLNRIWTTSIETVRWASQYQFEGCAWREPDQWIADARIMALVNHHVFGENILIRKAMDQFLRQQHSCGMIPAQGPQASEFWIPDFCAHLILMLHEDYMHTSDPAFLLEHQGALNRLMNWFIAQEDNEGFFVDFKVQWWIFLDWAALDKRGRISGMNMLYCQALKAWADLVPLLGQEPGLWRRKHERLKSAIHRRMFDRKRGLYVDCEVDGVASPHFSQQTNLLAISTGVCPPELVSGVLASILSCRDMVRIRGAFLNGFLVDSLFRFKRERDALELLDLFWGGMLDRGATTWWEVFDPDTPKSSVPNPFSKNTPTYLSEHIPVSHCHGWASSPAYLLLWNVLGVRMLEPGWKKVAVEPRCRTLDFCRGTVSTPLGPLSVDWTRGIDDSFTYKINAPHGMTVVTAGHV